MLKQIIKPENNIILSNGAGEFLRGQGIWM